MSKNDLIRRGDVYEAIYSLHADGKGGIMNAPRNSYGEDLRDVIDAIGDIPAVPQEMSARKYLETEARMSKYYRLPCVFDLPGVTVDEVIKMAEKFAREHPEENE